MKKIVKSMTSVILIISILTTFTLSGFSANKLPFSNSSFYYEGDYEIHYRVMPAAGTRLGRILLIHGLCSSTIVYERMAEFLCAQGYECVLVDLPGYGFSTRETENIAEIEREDLMVGVMESIAPLNEWVIGGHSMGGGVALNIAVQHPEIKGLMLYAPGSISSDGYEYVPIKAFGTLLNGLWFFLSRFNPLVRLGWFFITAEVEFTILYDMNKFTQPLRTKDTGMSMAYMMKRAEQNDPVAIKALTVPIMVIWAKNENVLTSKIKTRMREQLPVQTQVYTLPTGHMLVETMPKEAAELSLNFLAGLQ